MKAIRVFVGGMWMFLAKEGAGRGGVTNVIEDAKPFKDEDEDAETQARSLGGTLVDVPEKKPAK